MDLPTVKASVKAWEKAFKAQHKRDPTKDDIKRDSSGIGEHPGVTVTDTSRAVFAISETSKISVFIPISLSGRSSIELAGSFILYVPS
jgi:thiamine biosynthesis lipoprotein ApbE